MPDAFGAAFAADPDFGLTAAFAVAFLTAGFFTAAATNCLAAVLDFALDGAAAAFVKTFLPVFDPDVPVVVLDACLVCVDFIFAIAPIAAFATAFTFADFLVAILVVPCSASRTIHVSAGAWPGCMAIKKCFTLNSESAHAIRLRQAVPSKKDVARLVARH